MKPERLKDKKVKLHYGYDDTIEFEGFEYKDIKSAVEFYKKYRKDFFRFKRDFPDDAKEIEEMWKQQINIAWVDWLFDYCFEDVI